MGDNMIKFEVLDVRGCEVARGVLDPIALIGGNNRAGKTSVAQAIAATITGKPPYSGMNKSAAGMLVRRGAAEARVRVAGDAGSCSSEWPAGTMRADGEPPDADSFAVGLTSIATLDRRERALVLADYLEATPTKEDFVAAIGRGPHVDAGWKLIEDQGWDRAHATLKELGATLKGEWRAATGLNYGSRIAASYRPDLTHTEPQRRLAELVGAVTRAGQDVEHAISAAAVSASEHGRLEEEARRVGGLTVETERRGRAVAEAVELLEAAQLARQALPPIAHQEVASCPHCGADVAIERVSLVATRLSIPSAIVSGADLKQRRLAHAEADGKVANANDALHNARRAEAEASNLLDSAHAAAERIANWPAAIETGTDVEAARNALRQAEKARDEFHVKLRADEINVKIERNDALLDVLAPEGLRASKLRLVLRKFEDRRLRPLTDAAGWQPVEIGDDLALSIAGRPYWILSASEQYQLRTVVQIAMAIVAGADLVVIDGADILDGPSRSGLFDMLLAADMPAIVCMTLSRREQLPDLAQLGAGHSYWMASGKLEALAEKAAA